MDQEGRNCSKSSSAHKLRNEMVKALGWRLDNPAADITEGLPKQTRKPTRRKSLPCQEVADFLKVVEATGATEMSKTAIQLLKLTATRSNEVQLASWEEFDLERAEWSIPIERMKGREEHRIPLVAQTVAVLRRARGVSEAALAHKKKDRAEAAYA